MSPRDPALVVLDRFAIYDVMADYASGVDRRDWPLVRSCFAEDAFVEGTRLQAGLSEYLPVLIAEIEKFDRTVHFIGNQRVRLADDGAVAETYLVATHFWTGDRGRTCKMAISVRYRDELRRRGGWKIVNRRVVADWIYDDSRPDGDHWSLPSQGDDA